jgi:hypothetical protein
MSEPTTASEAHPDAQHNILLRNRQRHLRDRDAYYHAAQEDIEVLAQRLRALRDSSGGLEQLRELIERLALHFKRGLYHAILAAGGDFGRTRSPGITREEMVFSDYLKTMYSAARNIESYLSHELMLVRFCEGSEDVGPLVRQYIQQTKSYDQDIILRNMDLMVARVAIFNQTFLPEGHSEQWRQPEEGRADRHAER